MFLRAFLFAFFILLAFLMDCWKWVFGSGGKVEEEPPLMERLVQAVKAEVRNALDDQRNDLASFVKSSLRELARNQLALLNEVRDLAEELRVKETNSANDMADLRLRNTMAYCAELERTTRERCSAILEEAREASRQGRHYDPEPPRSRSPEYTPFQQQRSPEYTPCQPFFFTAPDQVD